MPIYHFQYFFKSKFIFFGPIGNYQISFIQIQNNNKLYYHQIKVHQLKNLSISQLSNISKSTTSIQNKLALFLLKGNNQNLLDSSQAKTIYDIISLDPLQTSCLIYDSKEVERKFDNWNKIFPWIKAHYAIKANPTRPILEDLHKKGAGFDCASRAEIQTVLSLGVNKESIVYSNPIKEEKDLMWAQNNGIQLTTADCIQQLIKIKQYSPSISVLWRISIKELASDNLSTPFSGKFGDDIDNQGKIHKRMEEIKQLGIKLKGIHFHCGSGLHGSSSFGRAVQLARKCLKIGRQYGHQMSIMDIGGGFSSKQINEKTIEALKTTQNDPLGYKVFAEPGRHFCSNAFYLLTRVLCKKIKNSKVCYHLNESLYHSFNCNLMDDVSFENKENLFYNKIQNGEKVEIQNLQNSTLFGMTCDGLDVIAKNVGVPSELKVGDWLCFSGMGAYTYGSRSNFNGMKSIQNVYRLYSLVNQQNKQSIDNASSEQTLSSEEESF